MSAFLLGVGLVAGLAACQMEGEGGATDASDPPTVEVTAVDYAFAAPDTIRSGWTTFRMKNEGQETHHFHLYRLPEEKRLEDFRKDYLTPLDSLLQLLEAGKIDTAEVQAAYDQHVRDWARPANLEKRGGMGAVAPGSTGQATFKVDPGTYVMDCTVRSPDGQLHRGLGMIHEITATETSTGASPPDADLTVSVSGKELQSDGPLPAGTQTVRFEVDSVAANADSAYFAFITRLNQDMGVKDLKQWTGQGYPYPVPTDYLGGFEYIETDRPVYTTVDLTPGRYAWHWGWFQGEEHDLFEEFAVENPE